MAEIPEKSLSGKFFQLVLSTLKSLRNSQVTEASFIWEWLNISLNVSYSLDHIGFPFKLQSTNVIHHPRTKVKEKKGTKEPQSTSTHIHAVSNLAADWSDCTERPLKRRRMQLSISPALKTTAVRVLSFELPPDSSHSLLFNQCQGENLPTNSAKGAMIIIHNSLVTIFITNMCHSC